MHYCSLLLPDTAVSFIRSPRKERQGGRERGNENDSEGEGEGEGEGRWGRRSRRGSGRPRERERERESGWVEYLSKPTAPMVLSSIDTLRANGWQLQRVSSVEQTKLNTTQTKPNNCRKLDQSM